MAKYILVFWWLRNIKFLLVDFTGYFVKQARSMPFCLVFLGEFVPFAFNRFNVQQFWAGNIFEVFKCIYQFCNIMSVNWPKVAKLKRFKKIAAVTYHPLQCSFHL